MIVDNKFFAHNGILVGNGNRVLGSYDVQYDVTVSSAGNGTASADKNRGHYGDIVNLSNTPESHYAFDHYTVNGVSTTNQSFALQSDANVVAYFTRTPGNSDWYYDDDYYTAKVDDRTWTGYCGPVVYAHQRFRAAVDPHNDTRFWTWSNYGVCRLYWSGYIGRRNDPATGLKFVGDAMTGLSSEDNIVWRAKDYYPSETTVSDVKVAIVIDFNNRRATVYTNNTVSFSTNVTLQCNGVFLGISTTGYPADPFPTLSHISMKIFEDEADALAFARFE